MQYRKWGDGATQPPSHYLRGLEEVSGGQPTQDAVVPHRRQTKGGDTAALRAIWIAAELARCDPGPQIGRQGMCGAREDAVLRTSRGPANLADHLFPHIQHRVSLAKPHQLLHHRLRCAGDRNSGHVAPRCGVNQAEPYSPDFGPRAPES